MWTTEERGAITFRHRQVPQILQRCGGGSRSPGLAEEKERDEHGEEEQRG